MDLNVFTFYVNIIPSASEAEQLKQKVVKTMEKKRFGMSITTLIAGALTVLKIAGIGAMATFKWSWIALIWLSPLILLGSITLVYLIFILLSKK